MTHTPGPWEVYPYEEKRGKFRYVVRSASKSITGWGNVTQLEPDANLIAAAPDLLDAAQLARAALEHDVPGDCWSTGPLTGDVIQDLVVCPGCAAIAAIDKAVSKGRPPKEKGKQ